MAQAGTDESLERDIEAVRRFSRFFTTKIGVLNRGYLNSGFSVAEGRVLYELAHRDGARAGDIAQDLEIDPAYVSRIVAGFEKQGLVRKTPAATDRRKTDLNLSDEGRTVFAGLNARSRQEIASLIGALPRAERARLVDALGTAQELLGASSSARVPTILRDPEPGDIGWVIRAHGAIYAREYGFDSTFEALVARIAADYLDNFQAGRERCWIAELEGAPVGSVFVVRQDDKVAKLRLLILDPAARGLGLGKRLVEECIRFAGRAGYETLTLWTNANLTAACAIYAAAGFKLVNEEPHRSFGQSLVGQTWDLDLRARQA